MTEQIQAAVEILRSEIHKLIHSIWKLWVSEIAGAFLQDYNLLK
jgi:hypothetical protein